MRATIDNVAKMGPAAALTGPIARGDAMTIRRHMEALETAPREIRDLYRLLGERTVELAFGRGAISQEVKNSILKMLA